MIINCIIPSLDRAMQLNCLLDSLAQNCPNLYEFLEIHVLWDYSEPAYREAYYLLEERFPHIHLHLQTDFHENIKWLLTFGEYSLFFTDDCVMYRKNYAGDLGLISWMEDDTWDFSFRMGENIKVQNYLDGQHHPQFNYTEKNDIMKWNWKILGNYYNAGYEFSWDGHLYRSEDILKRIKGKTFKNPRGMESIIVQDVKSRVENPRKYRVSPNLSCLVVNTINCVQSEPIPSGMFHHYSPEELNSRYLNGEVIDISGFDGINIVGCHTEVPLKFVKYQGK